MHARGHDAHTVWMLGVAKVLVGLKDQWSVTLVVYAQPAEEPGTGAQAMLDDGILTRGFPKPDIGMGSHTAPGPVGYVANAAGPRWAGMDQVDVTFIAVADPKRFAEAQKAGKLVPYTNHNPDFVVDLAAIPLGTKVNSVMALTLFAQ